MQEMLVAGQVCLQGVNGYSTIQKNPDLPAMRLFPASAHLTRTVWLLSWVSLLADFASEMLYPIMPIYLKSIGFSVVLIGLLEGLAEATAGLSKGYFGRLSDRQGRRLPFVQWGYGLSALSKPLLALTTAVGGVFLARSIDRLGKGLRTGARDALLSAETTPAHKGKVFGFHRGMDTLGAVLGPAAALVYLYFYPGQYRTLFLIAFLPGLLSVGCTLLLREKPASSQPVNKPPGRFFWHYWRESPSAYRRLVGGLLVFALFNSSDVFLLLLLRERGVPDLQVIGIYIFYNLVYAALAYPFGVLADRIGLKKVLMLGLALFAAVYSGMALNTAGWGFYALFAGYGAYAACTEGVAKALVSNLCDPRDTATAIGFFAGMNSIMALAASTLAGLLWHYGGPNAVFLWSAAGSLLVWGYFRMVWSRQQKEA